jgi:hypothetical protein
MSCPHCEQATAAVERMRVALAKASELIESEYCSHSGIPHGAENGRCYTDFIYRVLAQQQGRQGSPTSETPADSANSPSP